MSTYAPSSLLKLREYLKPKTGLSAGNLGIVGDTAHADRGTSYHLGKDQLTAGAYSRITPRDRAGLTNAASALDIGNHPDLRRLSLALVTACRFNKPGTDDIREVIYSPDGTRVLRWDRERGYASQPVQMVSNALNNTHRWHTHVSYYRDSEWVDKVGVFRPLYGEPLEDDLAAIKITPIGVTRAYIVRVAEKAVTYGPNDGERGSIGPRDDGRPAVRNALGVYGIDGLGGKRAFLLPDRTLILEDDVTFELNGRDPEVDTTAEPITYELLINGTTVEKGVTS